MEVPFHHPVWVFLRSATAPRPKPRTRTNQFMSDIYPFFLLRYACKSEASLPILCGYSSPLSAVLVQIRAVCVHARMLVVISNPFESKLDSMPQVEDKSGTLPKGCQKPPISSPRPGLLSFGKTSSPSPHHDHLSLPQVVWATNSVCCWLFRAAAICHAPSVVPKAPGI